MEGVVLQETAALIRAIKEAPEGLKDFEWRPHLQMETPSSPSSGSQAGVGKGRSGNRRISYREGYRAGNMTAHRQWRTLLRAVQRSLTPEG